MKKIKEMLQQGRLTEVIAHIETVLRDDPLNADLKSTLIELLCINGELERADKMLNGIVQKHPDFLVGALNLRQLIRAEQSRQDFINGKGIPNIFGKSDAHTKAFMALRLAINEGEQAVITKAGAALETARPQLALTINEQAHSEVRDLDDSLGGFIEIFGTDGKYYVAQLAEIEYIHFKPVNSIIEQVWRRVELSIKDGPSGEAHIPVVYGASVSDAEKLGRETDWHQSAPEVMTGVGQKMWFVDDQALPMTEFTRINGVA